MLTHALSKEIKKEIKEELETLKTEVSFDIVKKEEKEEQEIIELDVKLLIPYRLYILSFSFDDLPY